MAFSRAWHARSFTSCNRPFGELVARLLDVNEPPPDLGGKLVLLGGGAAKTVIVEKRTAAATAENQAARPLNKNLFTPYIIQESEKRGQYKQKQAYILRCGGGWIRTSEGISPLTS